MAMIERAFSLEIHDFVNAIEANELWMEGVLSDKKAFVCVGEGCIAGITCKNMDKLAADRKQIPHFIMSQHENMHSDSCEVFREIEEIDQFVYILLLPQIISMVKKLLECYFMRMFFLLKKNYIVK